MGGETASDLVSIEEQAAEGREHREGQHHVEDRGAARDEVHAVEGDEQPRHRADEIRTRETPSDARGHEDRQGPQDGDGEAPSEGGHPEEPLAASDDPLTEGWMHDERRIVLEDIDGAPVAVRREDQLVGAVVELLLVAVAQEGEGVLRVVDLVEGEGIGAPEVDEAQQPPHDGHRDRACPAAPSGGGEWGEEAGRCRCHGWDRSFRRTTVRGRSGRRCHRPIVGTLRGMVAWTARMAA